MNRFTAGGIESGGDLGYIRLLLRYVFIHGT